MSRETITVIPGDGIGPEIMDATLKVLGKLDCDFDYDFAEAGITSLKKTNEVLPEKVIQLVQKNRVLLKGPLTTPIGQGFTSINVTLRRRFNLFANVRPVTSFPNTKSRYEDIDIITMRENTEGMYSGEGQTLTTDGSRAEAMSIVTRKGSVQLLDYTYDLAKRLGRKKITIVHKANIMKTTSGLFLEVARTLAQKHPEIETNEMIVDNAAMQLVMNPHQFDIIATTNLFGDILSDLCAGLVGGLGVAPGANIGLDYSMFEAVHGSAPDIAGMNRANPTSLMLAAALMLDHLDLGIKARILRNALRDVYESKDRLTQDMGGTGSTDDFTNAVIDRL